MYTKIPVFEVMSWPESELNYWAAFFSIDHNKDKPTFSNIRKHVTVEQSIADMKRVLG